MNVFGDYLLGITRNKEADQLRVQLAGCSMAAIGGSPTIERGSYGWSPAYQDVLNLRRKYEIYEELIRKDK